jgi:hypothetical protein
VGEIVIHAPRQSVRDGWPTISAVIEIEDARHDIYFRCSRGPLTTNADPFLAIAITPAMRLGHSIAVTAPVSAGLLDHMTRIQDIFWRWYPDEMHRVNIHTEGRDDSAATKKRRVGSFYSGGIDSSYNALKNATEIDDLIFVHGFDVPLADTGLRQLISGRLREAAAELGRPLVEVETNLRELLDPHTDWMLHSHGAALGAVGLAIAPQFRKIFIASSHNYATIRPHGSHIVLDPLWGHQNLEFFHDGCEHSRWHKAERIIENPTVQRYLRVCWAKNRTEYNCGRCPSCVMVMAFLRITGMADRCAAFPPLDLEQIRTATIETTGDRGFYDRLVDLIEERSQRGLGRDQELLAALQERLKRAEDEGHPFLVMTPELRRVQAELAGLKVDNRRLKAQLRQMQESRYWRMGAPLRAAGKLVRRLLHRQRS